MRKRPTSQSKLHRINQASDSKELIIKQKKYKTNYEKRELDEFDRFERNLRKKDKTKWKLLMGKVFLDLKFSRM